MVSFGSVDGVSVTDPWSFDERRMALMAADARKTSGFSYFMFFTSFILLY